MIQIPASLSNKYTAFTWQRSVRKGHHRHYVKWLRYYLDFCHKYGLNQDERWALPAFMAKLQAKKQAENMRQPAHHAVTLFQAVGLDSGRDFFGEMSPVKATANAHYLPVPLVSHNSKSSLNQGDSPGAKAQFSAGTPVSLRNKVFGAGGADGTEVFSELDAIF